MLHAVILAGGSGSRLWPLSRADLPKQFLPLLSERSLLQETVLRLQGLVPPERIVVVTSSDQEPLVCTHLRQLPDFAADRVQIILEPMRRNTAAAIGIAAVQVQHSDPNATMLVLPADHWISQNSEFVAVVKQSVGWAERGALVTFGVPPTRPETGYGYIQRGTACRKYVSASDAYQVERFIEKPPVVDAQRYLMSGLYYWNAGIFLWQATTILQEIAAFLPNLAVGLRAVADSFQGNSIGATIDEVYSQLESISIDYGVLEKSSHLVVVPADIGWSDVGEWAAIHRLSPHDERGNATHGKTIIKDSDNSLVYSNHRLVAALGLKDVVVVETDEAVLVSMRDRLQEVKTLGEQVQSQKRGSKSCSDPVLRHWGTYTVLEEGPGYKVKRLVLFPGASISLQYHHYRSEHWVVVHGMARVTKGAEEFLLQANGSTYLPQGTVHRLTNVGSKPLEVIEVQTGSYFGEDDIVRLSTQ